MRILRERAGRVFNSAVAPVVYHNIVEVVAYVSRYALRHRPAAAAASALRERVAPGLACPMSHVPAEAR